jgi:hypothetical protein
MAFNRKTTRQAVATLLENSCPSAQEVYAYKPRDLAGESPILAVLSAGSNRQPYTMAGNKAAFFLEIHSFVLDGLADGSWTAQEAEDALDQMEYEVGAALEKSRQSPGQWQSILYDLDRSEIRSIIISGIPYLEEIIPVRVEVY